MGQSLIAELITSGGIEHRKPLSANVHLPEVSLWILT